MLSLRTCEVDLTEWFQVRQSKITIWASYQWNGPTVFYPWQPNEQTHCGCVIALNKGRSHNNNILNSRVDEKIEVLRHNRWTCWLQSICHLNIANWMVWSVPMAMAMVVGILPCWSLLQKPRRKEHRPLMMAWFIIQHLFRACSTSHSDYPRSPTRMCKQSVAPSS